MINNREYALFPLISYQDTIITIDPGEASKEVDEELGGQNLKKVFKLPA